MSNIDINLITGDYVHYYQYIKGISPLKRLYIKADDLLEGVDISITSSPSFLINYDIKDVTLPRKSKIAFDVNVMLSPLYLVSLDESIDGEIIVSVTKDGKELSNVTSPIRVLSYNTLRYREDPLLLASFVGRSTTIADMTASAKRVLLDWKKNTSISYTKASKNDIRYSLAAIYKTFIDLSLVAMCDSESDEISIISHEDIVRNAVADPLSLAVMVTSVIENIGLNPVIARCHGEWLVGAWLKEECFPEYIIDAPEFLTKRMALGVNDFTIFSINDIFNKIAFEASEKRCLSILKKDFDFALDIRRARIGRIYALPTRVKKKGGYDLIDDNIYDTDSVPTDIKVYDKEVGLDSHITKEMQWLRRLLDLSMRNSLLNFKESKSSIKIVGSTISDFVTRYDESREYAILPRPNGVEELKPFDGRLTLAPTIDLINIEMNNAKLHANVAIEDFDKAMLAIYRKDKVFLEESGTSSLYLAVGFLKYKVDGEKELKYSPIFLYPVKLIKKTGSQDSYFIKLIDDEVRINSTLLEYLFQEFSLDLRGLGNEDHLDSETMLAIIGRIRREIVDRAGWDISEDIYLTNSSFNNYLMWNDIKNRIDDFRKNKLIAGFIDNTKRVFDNEDYVLSDAHSDDTYNKDGIYLPLSADSSQYSAIVDSLDKSFVLHGPPGTGKSQTITNIIANNILRGRRVLFVAEKMAALSVVEKRLEEIGLGDFCLELHSNKNNKTDVVKKLIHTMGLSSAEEAEDYEERADEIRGLIEGIEESMHALHKPRRLGVSVYEGAMRYLENIDAKESLKIEPIFYERLTKESLSKYESLLTELVSVGRDCGEISSSPYKYIGDVELDDTFRARGEELIDILSIEIAHIRDYAERLMELIKVRTTAITNDRLEAMYNICMLISSNDAVRAYIKNSKRWDNAYGIISSYKANNDRRQELLIELLKIYDHIPDDLPRELLIDSNDRHHARAVKKTMRTMSKFIISPSPTASEDGIKLLINLYEVESNIASIKSEVIAIFGGDENIESDVVSIDLLFDSAKVLYADYRQETFESIMSSVIDGKYIIGHFTSQYEMYKKSYQSFKRLFEYNLEDGAIDIQDLALYLKHLRSNLDLMPSWVKYNELLGECKKLGLQFIVTPLRDGNISLDEVLKSFRKCVYGNFVESELTLDKTLSSFSGKSVEEKIDKLKMLSDNYEQLTREEMYYRMVSRIPHQDAEGAHNIEMVMLSRAEKSNMKGVTLRKLFLDVPTVMKYACPCMLMSPTSVAQYLDMDLDKFDLVVFDEASQMPTAEAIGSIARAKDVIVVGDPKQLPPTKFFNSEYKDEENAYLEDLESILDDCLALGMPERHLLWHYRSQDESLIAFSNAMYYENRLLTFPSPMELDSKVKFRYVDGVYERGGSKRNKKEAETLVSEVVRRLSDGKHMSIGIVTFNTAQQNYIDDLLRDAIKKNNLYHEAYEVDEPIFVKNLENVQGDERDIIFFSVGYGPDSNGKLSLNFGPINQSGGYRRLNVAITRARCEMMVFSSITGHMIDLSRTDNKGVKGLKAFLEYAERGRDMLVLDSKDIKRNERKGIGAYIAEDLRERGFECEYDVGVSNFKIDVAVVDPKHKDRYILAIMCDGDNANKIGSVRDRMTMNVKILKRLGWNVYYLWTINYLNNSKREIQKIREYLMSLTKSKAPSKKAIKEIVSKYKKNYRAYNAKPLAKGSADYILDDKNSSAILDKIIEIVSIESPIEQDVLMTRLCTIYNITKQSKKAYARLIEIASTVGTIDKFMDKTFYRIERDNEYGEYRPIDEGKGKREIDEVHPYEIIACMRCILEGKIKLSRDELIKDTLELIGYTRKTKIAPIWVNMAIDMAIENGRLIEAPNETITM